MKVEKLVVGQTVLVKARYNRNSDWKEVTVKSVGKKYYTLSDGEKYLIEDLTHHNPVYGSQSDLRFSWKQLHDEELADELIGKIRGFVGSYGSTKIELSKLKEILEILNR